MRCFEGRVYDMWRGALLYFGGVTATQALLRTLTGEEQLPQLVVVASTLVIAALFNPLRHR